MDRLTELRDEAKHDLETELRDLLPLLSAARGIVSHSPNATITVSAGGIGIWVAVTACVATLTGLLVGVIFVAIYLSDLNRQTQELRESDQVIQAYINAGMVQPKDPE